jgi:hypothetical protein
LSEQRDIKQEIVIYIDIRYYIYVMTGSKSTDKTPRPIRGQNPYCPVCAEEEGKETQTKDQGAAKGHNCLLTILNTHYLLSRKGKNKA